MKSNSGRCCWLAQSPDRCITIAPGKHAAMLATARHLREPVDGYWDAAHPVQLRIRTVLEDLCGMKI